MSVKVIMVRHGFLLDDGEQQTMLVSMTEYCEHWYITATLHQCDIGVTEATRKEEVFRHYMHPEQPDPEANKIKFYNESLLWYVRGLVLQTLVGPWEPNHGRIVDMQKAMEDMKAECQQWMLAAEEGYKIFFDVR